MPARCSVPGCCTKAEKGSGPRFYCIPSEINFTGKASPLRVSRRKKWIAALKLQHLQDHQLKNIRICGLHFITGKPADQYFVQHPDWIPSQKLNLKEQNATSQTKTDFLNNLQLDGIKKSSLSSAKKDLPSEQDDTSSDFISDDLLKYSKPQKRCCVASCMNRMSKTKNSSPPIYYHTFPEVPLCRNRWMFLCQKKGTWDPDHCYICSDHFTSDDYAKEGVLKETSVPSVKLNSGSTVSGKDLIVLEGNPGTCCIPWCKTCRSDEKVMRPFPAEEIDLKIWIANIFGAQVPVVPSEGAVICQDHFTTDQWSPSPQGTILKSKAVPSLFEVKASPLPKEPYKRKSDPLKDKATRLKSSTVKKDISEGELENKVEEILKNRPNAFSADTVVRVVRIVKNNKLLSDHTYSGMDSPNVSSSNEKYELRKRNNEAPPDDFAKRMKLEYSVEKDNPDIESYKNLEELMADLIGDDNLEEVATEDVRRTVTSSTQEDQVARIVDGPHDSFDDYSDYSETDSDSEEGKVSAKPAPRLSNDMKELTEALNFQLQDLKSENKELIEENERLRNELNLLKSDPKHASLNLEKSQFMNLVAKLMRNFLNIDQILYLIKANDPTNAIVWSNETLSKSLEIHKACSDEGYDLLVDSGFPLPPRRLFSMLQREKNSLLPGNESN